MKQAEAAAMTEMTVELAVQVVELVAADAKWQR